MAGQELESAGAVAIEHYNVEIPLRGYDLDLAAVRTLYRDLQKLSFAQGEKAVARLSQEPTESDVEFDKRRRFLAVEAFRITVSIVGPNGRVTYGNSEAVFDSEKLPRPIQTIFMTNLTVFRNHAGGRDPDDVIQLWLIFGKPPVFDPNPLQSEPTPNASRAFVKADDHSFYLAAQTAVLEALRPHKAWYAFLHRTFVYDVILWLFWLPYALYRVTWLNDRLLPANGPHSSYRVALFIYGLGIAVALYRTLMSYAKWAYPVNVLRENADRASWHRGLFSVLALSVVGSALWELIKLAF